MGREAVVTVEAGAELAEAKVLLESTELLIRAPLRRRYPLAAIEALSVDGDSLTFRHGAEPVTLHLGASVAAAWAKVIAAPPPTLRAKLGLDTARAHLVGPLDDDALAAALDGLTADLASANMIVARVDTAADLDTTLDTHATRPELPLWLVYPKGKVVFGETAIRQCLRAAGFRDSKSCAVSDRLTATRYALPLRTPAAR